MINTVTTIPIGDCRIEIVNLYNLLKIAGRQSEITHNHSFYEMHFIKRGVSKLMVNDVLYEAGENYIIVIPKNSYHYAFSNDENLQFVAFNFDIIKEKKSSTIKKQEYAYFMSAFETDEPIILPFYDKLAQKYDQIIELQKKHDIYSVNKLRITVIDFFLEFVNIVSKKIISKDEEFKKSKYSDDAIRKHRVEELLAVNHNYKLEDFAREVYLSPRQFERFIYRIYGKNFKELIVENRMLKSVQLIKEGKYSLSKIATLVGYDSYSGFLSAYRKYYGVNPTDKMPTENN